MGFEVTFTYFDKTEDGDFNREEPKTFLKKIGKAMDEVPVEKLAFLIMNQRSRRDIWVDGVEIYEFVRKKLSFKESSSGDGIVIGNKKFGANTDFDGLTVSETVDDSETSVIVQLQQQVAALVKQVKQVPKQAPKKALIAQQETPTILDSSGNLTPESIPEAPFKYEYFAPDKMLIAQFRDQGLKLTPEKKYPVYKEFTKNRNIFYIVDDDKGNKTTISSIHFIPNLQPIDSMGENLLVSTTDSMSNGMDQSGSDMYSAMPDIRR